MVPVILDPRAYAVSPERISLAVAVASDVSSPPPVGMASILLAKFSAGMGALVPSLVRMAFAMAVRLSS